MSKETYLVTGASDGIGAVYADRLAKRGHGLVLVARRADRLADLAARLRRETGAAVDVIAADLADPQDLAKVEARLRDDAAVTGLVNNAGVAGEGPFVDADPAHVSGMIALNVTAVARLAGAVAPRLVARGAGTIVNVASVTALMPDAFTAVYPATKAFVLAFTEAIAKELGKTGVRVQAVLPGVTRTAIWEAERLAALPEAMVMDVEDMVDAALAGLDLGETITIPSLPDAEDLAAFLAARARLAPNLSRRTPAARYAR